MTEKPRYVDASDAHAISIISQSTNRPRAFRRLKRELDKEVAARPEMRQATEETLVLLRKVFPDVNERLPPV